MRVLFICYGNAYCSPFAEAILKKLRPELEVDSAGLHVAIPISREVKDYLRSHNTMQYITGFSWEHRWKETERLRCDCNDGPES